MVVSKDVMSRYGMKTKDLVVSAILVLYIIMGSKLPEESKKFLASGLGVLVMVGAVVVMFFMFNPVTAFLGFVAAATAYSTASESYPLLNKQMKEYEKSSDSKPSSVTTSPTYSDEDDIKTTDEILDMGETGFGGEQQHGEHPQSGVTLEEEVIDSMAPIPTSSVSTINVEEDMFAPVLAKSSAGSPL